ncbi:homeobox protein HOX1A-like [Iris pallida]|uniref:Homeobox protein HOX1A-like n=1 Tax=Iris pallida TaxID=29817 RepID=A0AAX6G483_IRIPA|nr:homeobox protein HOX1A-like [Iris pallida]
MSCFLKETYGKSSSDSSEDEDWLESADMSTPKKGKRMTLEKGLMCCPRQMLGTLRIKGVPEVMHIIL